MCQKKQLIKIIISYIKMLHWKIMKNEIKKCGCSAVS